MLIDATIHKANALVIDSNANSRSLITSQLRELGLGFVRAVTRVKDARIVLENAPYDLVICDYHFEGHEESGQDLLDELRRENLLPYSTVFMMITGEATYATVAEAAEAALDGYLIKPYTLNALAERIQALCDEALFLQAHALTLPHGPLEGWTGTACLIAASRLAAHTG